MMRIATFNLWNSSVLWPARLKAACEELTRIDADVVALQEVPFAVGERDASYLGNVADFISENTRNAYCVFRQYPDDTTEGVAFISKHPFSTVEAGWETSFTDLGDCGLRVTIDIKGLMVGITNVHLDYRSIATREKQIVAVSDWIEARSEEPFLEFLCGDFNCYPESSVYRFLMGQQTIRGQAASVWHDLASSYAAKTGAPPMPTLDFLTNPRWKSTPTLEVPARFDWILLKDRWPLKSPSVTLVERFGLNPTPQAQVVPSDHYGVLADVVP